MNQPLSGRVAVITGSSRGIGREFALRLAREGAAVVITGKSETDTERLPGTIHSVADEVRQLGGKALAVRLDVRDETQIAQMVAKTVDHFGRIDILINNAGALWWEKLLDTPPKRVGLMFDVNLRASYLTSYYALPVMIESGGGHVVSCSPPISLDANPGHVMYQTMKMGMTRLAIGIAAEYGSQGISANSLWPAAPIDSFATRNWSADKMGEPEQWRTPAILCDALMEVVGSAPGACTGRQLVDEVFLRERGWSDDAIDRYWLSGKAPVNPLWIDGRADAAM